MVEDNSDLTNQAGEQVFHHYYIPRTRCKSKIGSV